MGPRFSEEVEEFLRVSGPTTEADLLHHFEKWGADPTTLGEALAWLVREGRVRRALDPEERYRWVERR